MRSPMPGPLGSWSGLTSRRRSPAMLRPPILRPALFSDRRCTRWRLPGFLGLSLVFLPLAEPRVAGRRAGVFFFIWFFFLGAMMRLLDGWSFPIIGRGMDA